MSDLTTATLREAVEDLRRAGSEYDKARQEWMAAEPGVESAETFPAVQRAETKLRERAMWHSHALMLAGEALFRFTQAGYESLRARAEGDANARFAGMGAAWSSYVSAHVDGQLAAERRLGEIVADLNKPAAPVEIPAEVEEGGK